MITLPAINWHILDSSLIKELGKIEVFRPFYFEYREIIPGDIAKFFRPLERRYLFPDKFVMWNYFAFRYVCRHFSKNKPDVVYSSSGPHSTLALAAKVKSALEVPTMVDLRDPFSFSQYSILDKAGPVWGKRARALEYSVFETVDKINIVTAIWRDKYLSLYPNLKHKMICIPNGYDERDFAGLDFSQPQNKVFTLGYNGTFSRIVPIEPLLKAIASIHKKHGVRIKLNIATPIKESKIRSNFPYLFEHGLIEHRGFLSHKKSLANLSKSDALALILADIPATKGMVPGKTYEYLRMNRPILLLNKRRGFLSQIIEKTNTGQTVDIHDSQDIKKGLLLFQVKWQTDQLEHRPIMEEVRKYERKALSADLAANFDCMAKA